MAPTVRLVAREKPERMYHFPPIPQKARNGWGTKQRRQDGGGGQLLRALVVFLEERDVEGQFGVGLLLLPGVRFFAQGGALRVDAQPAAMDALKDVREDAFLVGFGRIHLVMERVSSIGHSDVPEHADGDDALFEMD